MQKEGNIIKMYYIFEKRRHPFFWSGILEGHTVLPITDNYFDANLIDNRIGIE